VLDEKLNVAIVAYFKALPRHLAGGGQRKTAKNFSQHKRFPGRDLNPDASGYDAGIML
jgi:hypothetical protein